jgi:hypothetical protein
VGQTIPQEFPLVNKIVSAGMKIFLKAPKRVEVFKEILPGVPLPPEPVLTRWGTWLNAAFYYNKHLEGFKKVVEMLGEDAASITEAKSILQEHALCSQLFFWHPISLRFLRR